MEGIHYRWYILFPNHHQGLRLCRELMGQSIKHTVAPTPRIASTSCGMSVIVNEADLSAIRATITELGIIIEKIVQVPIKKDGWQYRGG